jgi:hypothetical protein
MYISIIFNLIFFLLLSMTFLIICLSLDKHKVALFFLLLVHIILNIHCIMIFQFFS